MKTLPKFLLSALAAAALLSRAQAADAPALPVSATNLLDDLRLNPMDKLSFTIREDPVKSSTATVVPVLSTFDLYFPVSAGFDEIITINARGKTLGQIRQELKKILDTDFYYDATVELRVLSTNPRKGEVLFSGAVRNSVLLLNSGEPRTLAEGILQMGVTDFANLKKVRLTRLDPVTHKPVKRTIDVKAILDGDRKEDLPLQDGDRIEIPERGLVL